MREKLGIGDKLVIGTVGTMIPVKNPDAIIDVFYNVKLVNENAVLLWVGDGPMREEISNKLDKLGLRKSVLMLGSRDDVSSLMQAMDVFIFPSKSEGLGIVAIEAQAAGLLTLCSKHVPKEVAITDNCMFIEDDVTDWVNAIIGNNKVRKNTTELIEKAGYDIKSVASEMEQFYITCIKER